MRQAIGPAVILLGLLLLLASHFARDPGGARYWSEDDQATYREAALTFHKLAHAPAPPPGKRVLRATTDELETARQRFEVEHRRLEAARGAQRRTGGALFWGGVAAVAVGIGAALFSRRS